MSAKPLAYESLKCVLQFMDPNKRFLIANACPSAKTTENLIPLKIDKLKFTKGEVMVNETTYRVGIYRQCHNWEQRWRKRIKYEIDNYMRSATGFNQHFDEMRLTPGDVKFGGETEETPEMLDCVEDLDRDQAVLTAFQMRWTNIPPEYLIRLTVKSEGNTHIESYHDNKKCSMAMKQLGKFLFGGRRSAIHVKDFELDEDHVLRLPVGLKFRIDKLCFPGKVGLNLMALNPIIDHSSYPLQLLQINQLSEEDANNEVVNGAKLLKISYKFGFEFVPGVLRLSNRRVHVSGQPAWASALIAVTVLANWKANPRPIGTNYTLTFSEFGGLSLKDLTDKIRWEIDGVIERNGCLAIPVDESVEIEVHYVKELQDIEKESSHKFVRIMVVSAN